MNVVTGSDCNVNKSRNMLVGVNEINNGECVGKLSINKICLVCVHDVLCRVRRGQNMILGCIPTTS